MNILSANLNGLTKYFIGTEVEVTYYSRSQNKVLKTKINKRTVSSYLWVYLQFFII